MLAWMWIKGNSCTLPVGKQISRDIMENSMEVPPEITNVTTM
jgi:hypothetical protein